MWSEKKNIPDLYIEILIVFCCILSIVAHPRIKCASSFDEVYAPWGLWYTEFAVEMMMKMVVNHVRTAGEQIFVGNHIEWEKNATKRIGHMNWHLWQRAEQMLSAQNVTYVTFLIALFTSLSIYLDLYISRSSSLSFFLALPLFASPFQSRSSLLFDLKIYVFFFCRVQRIRPHLESDTVHMRFQFIRTHFCITSIEWIPDIGETYNPTRKKNVRNAGQMTVRM